MTQYADIDSGQLKSCTGKKKAVLVGSRTYVEYLQAHIPGAISIPTDKMKMNQAKLPKDKSTPVIC